MTRPVGWAKTRHRDPYMVFIGKMAQLFKQNFVPDN